MPELPDVQVYKEYLDATSLHQRMEGVDVSRDEVLGNVSTRSLQRRLSGRTLESTRRHGKYLFVRVSDSEWLVFHFGMTGYPAYASAREPPRHTRVLFRFAKGFHLAYVSQRMIGKIEWAKDPDAFIKQHRLGIDALDHALDAERFRDAIQRKRGSIKSALMNQETIAGLGNVYTDEILFQAGLHPRSAVSDIDQASLTKIHRQMRRVLNSAIKARAQPDRMPKGFLTPRRGAEDATCPRCGKPLEKTKVSGRTTYFCLSCQTMQ
jgi:formamidopyrimidine-DNA glycosylase